MPAKKKAKKKAVKKAIKTPAPKTKKATKKTKAVRGKGDSVVIEADQDATEKKKSQHVVMRGNLDPKLVDDTDEPELY